MKIELGGSGAGNKYARGDDWVNIDLDPGATIQHDLDKLPWPVQDDAAEEIYTSHCLEHLQDPNAVLNEIARIGRVGAKVEIRCPHPFNHLAMVAGHKHVFSPVQAINMEVYFPQDFWPNPKRLRLGPIEYAPTFLLHAAKGEMPFLKAYPDDVIMRWIPGTCHECRFHYTVVENEYYKKP